MDQRKHRILFLISFGLATSLHAPFAVAADPREERPGDLPWEDTQKDLAGKTGGATSGRKLPSEQKTNAKPEESASKPPSDQTGLREGDKIILNGESDYQRKIWNEQRDRESLDIRMQAAQGSYHRQGVSIEMTPSAPDLSQPPRVVEEFTDANGNVWERVRVDKQDVSKFLEENKNSIRAGEMTPTIMVSVSPPRLLNEPTDKEKNVMDEKAGKSTPPAMVKGELNEPSALNEKEEKKDPAVVFFDAVKNAAAEKPKDEEKLAELPENKKPLPEKTDAGSGSPSEITFNNDVEFSEGRESSGSEDVLRLKSAGRKPASQGPAIEEAQLKSGYVKAGADFTEPGFDYAGFNKGFTSQSQKATSLFKMLIALLATIITFFLIRETNLWAAIGLKLVEKSPRLAVWWGMISRKSKSG